MATGTDTTAFSSVLKDVYIDGVREQINQNTNLLDFFTKEDVKSYEWEGNQLVLALHSSRNASGVKYVAERGALPIAGSQGTARLLIPMKFLEGRIQLTAQVMKASRNSKGAFISAMNLEQKGLVNDISRQRNRVLASFGQGTLAQINAGANSTTQALKAPGGVSGSTNPCRFIQVGMYITVIDPTGATVRGGANVTAVSQPNITLDAAINTTTGDLVQIGSNSVSTAEASYNAESMGILGMADSTTYVTTFMGLDRSQAANAFFRSTITSSVGALSSDVLQRAIDNAWEISGEQVDQFVCHTSVRREVLKLAEADRRYAAGSSPINPDAGTLAGMPAKGKDITFNGVPFRQDKDLAYGTIIGVVKSHLLQFEEVGGEWADDDGTVLFRVPNVDAYEARYRLWENFATDKGSALLRLDGVTATVSSGVYSG